ncbi:hypothetical protein Tsubulata_000686 [Turnera subulata]|uniref:EF-hand domain-containing protein n=1 Tax=Turnera subulata TaxID=218843 RepID=A0A9Q0J7F9_9ROSI|nr:hypothetical protein Tsubulata_000686 [Turnera subulata]
MSAAVVNQTTVTEFVEDTKAFDVCVKHLFDMLDCNGDEVLKRDDLRQRFSKLLSLDSETHSKESRDELYNTIFNKFDENRNGTMDHGQFRSLIREILYAMARGIGNTPVLMALEGDSLLMKAVEHESSQCH